MKLAVRLRRLVVVFALLALAACAPVRTREDAGTLRAQVERERQFVGKDRWALQARLGVSNGEDGGSGELEWNQDGERYEFTVRAPVTGKTWRLHGDTHAATLDGVRDTTLRGANAAELLEREVGWHVPMDELPYWVRGLRAPNGKAELTFDAQNRPAELLQSGWKVEYRDWFDDGTPSLPKKVFATRGKYRVRLSVERWTQN